MSLPPPDFGRWIAARGEQPVQDRQERGPLDVELESPLYEQSPEDLGQARFFPEKLEDQYRAYSVYRVR